ncbi:unnamed protein product [Adineta steineri]|uniref:Uncharacterized protein n=1 Tax=Adineta steineri TaxID=433720 RepID=A0A819KYK6_9BILA|nr:unnamed protein product [Adineta steineri]CAF3952330.1 unnamed protein product [Adineta steineri]
MSYKRLFLYYVIFLSLIFSSVSAIEPVCKWYGIAPFCFIGNSCPENCWQAAASDRGDGAYCWFDQKNYCCCVKKAIDSIINSLVNSN